jgi:hypothetical protein
MSMIRDVSTPKVWISATGRDVALGSDGPGMHWHEVGTINTTHETDLWKNVQVHLGLRASAPRLTGFYLAGRKDDPWVVQARGEEVDSPFWLAIDPFGDGTRYLVTIERASLGVLARRPAEPHPGLLDRPVAVGIRVKRSDNRVFEFVRP